MIEIQAPNMITSKTPDNHRIFLAGSIEMGSAIEWQSTIINYFKDNKGVTFLNPRRNNWDSSWEQKITNPQFYQQVNWELNALELADLIVMYFDVNTKSPISLLELGLYADSDKLIVCCPEGFWKKGNVDIICDKYDITNFDTLEAMISFMDKLTID